MDKQEAEPLGPATRLQPKYRTPASTSHDQLAHCRREVIRSQARKDRAQAEVWQLLAAFAAAGEVIPLEVLIDPPAFIAWEGGER